MTETQFNFVNDHQGAPIKMWTRGVQVEEQAMQQLRNVASLPFIHKHVAAMPDCHWGMGATVGSVIATKGAIVPAAVGVDIGCGMMAVRTNLVASDLPDSLASVRSEIESAVPHGRTDDGGKNDRGAWSDVPPAIAQAFVAISSGLERIVDRNSKVGRAAEKAHKHLGTLGTGNHFIEVCLDLEGNVWVMLHSGSRGIGSTPWPKNGGRSIRRRIRPPPETSDSTSTSAYSYSESAPRWSYARPSNSTA